MRLLNCTLGDGHIRDFANALEESGCAKRLAALTFVSCGVSVEGVSVLDLLIGRDVFPALKTLFVERNPNISDVGILALAKALKKSTQTCLELLSFYDVGWGTKAMPR